MPKHRYIRLVEKSRDACITAIETFNSISTSYRDEAFVIMMINAWEMLLKAKILKDNKGKIESIYAKEKIDIVKDKRRKKYRYKLNRNKTPQTIGLEKCINIAGDEGRPIDRSCAANLIALMEFRDSATHFMCEEAAIKKAVTELGLACVRNYVLFSQTWFGLSFSDLNIATLPMSFDLDQRVVEATAIKSSEGALKFIEFVKELNGDVSGDESEYTFTVTVSYELIKNGAELPVRASNVRENPDHTVSLLPNTLPPGFVWDFETLKDKIAKSYPHIKVNNKFHDAMRPLRSDPRYTFDNFADPLKKNGKKQYFNPNIMAALIQALENQ